MEKLKILVACEESQTVCKAFRELGHEAYSCDIQECSGGYPQWHIQDDVLNHLDNNWDLIIAHPPCTHLAVSGARWFRYKKEEQKEALEFVNRLLNANCKYIALENPVSVISSKIRKPEQIIHPWMFGHGEKKTTCLWLKNLPKLTPTYIVNERKDRIHKMPPSKNRAKLRSKTFEGIAKAMAEQWSRYILEDKNKKETNIIKEVR